MYTQTFLTTSVRAIFWASATLLLDAFRAALPARRFSAVIFFNSAFVIVVFFVVVVGATVVFVVVVIAIEG